MKKLSKPSLLTIIGTLLVVCLLADLWFRYSASSSAPATQIRVNSPEYEFINPLLFSDNAKSFSPYSNKLAAMLASSISDIKHSTSSIESVSVYFRDLNSGQWTGANEDTLYKPSSMLKVLAMMAALKVAEGDPAILSQKMQFQKRVAGGIYYEGNKTMKDGSYTVSQLIDAMILNSDNDALLSLVSDKRIDEEFQKTYRLLRLPPEGLLEDAPDFMSPKSYATLFRVLYNSTFFTWHVSDQTLSLLSKTTFDGGLVAGVPAGVVVAHKFGENLDQLHDCGIVYYPGKPYLLCVMTKGSSLSALESAIAEVSREVYAYIDATAAQK